MKTIIAFAIILALFLASVYGYIANIVYLVSHNEAVGLSLARAVGIFLAPLGVILGFV